MTMPGPLVGFFFPTFCQHTQKIWKKTAKTTFLPLTCQKRVALLRIKNLSFSFRQGREPSSNKKKNQVQVLKIMYFCWCMFSLITFRHWLGRKKKSIWCAKTLSYLPCEVNECASKLINLTSFDRGQRVTNPGLWGRERERPTSWKEGNGRAFFSLTQKSYHLNPRKKKKESFYGTRNQEGRKEKKKVNWPWEEGESNVHAAAKLVSEVWANKKESSRLPRFAYSHDGMNYEATFFLLRQQEQEIVFEKESVKKCREKKAKQDKALALSRRQ